MLLYYVRHGHPTYDPDALTPLGWKQAEALAKRLATFGVDRIFSSTSTRAMETAQPTCDLVRKEKTLLPFAHEDRTWERFSMPLDEKNSSWLFEHPEAIRLFTDPEVLALRHEWYRHPGFAPYDFGKSVEWIREESDRFLASLGYEHIPGTGAYRVIQSNNERVALFAHAGFGLAFLSTLLDIPYSQFAIHFDLNHSGLTVIEFRERDGIAIPRICTFSSDSHLYREGLPTEYNFRFRY